MVGFEQLLFDIVTPVGLAEKLDGEYLLALMTLTSTVPLQSCPAGIDQLCCKPQVVHNRLAGEDL